MGWISDTCARLARAHAPQPGTLFLVWQSLLHGCPIGSPVPTHEALASAHGSSCSPPAFAWGKNLLPLLARSAEPARSHGNCRACAVSDPRTRQRCRYAFGECYYEVTKDQAEELLDSRKEKIEAESQGVEDEIATIKGTLAQLKTQLYGRFGKNINLEENPGS